jgi:hypothetical protein
MDTFTGKVVRKAFAVGSKSEHEAVHLRTDQGDFVLRIRDGNAFRDPRLEKLVGKTIRCWGEIQDYNLVVSSWREVKAK